MSGILWRVLMAVASVIVAYALIPPVCRVIGFDLTGDVLTIVRVCIAGIAVFYILRGSSPPWTRA